MSLKRKHSALHGARGTISSKQIKLPKTGTLEDSSSRGPPLALHTSVRDLLSSLRTGPLSNAAVSSRLQALEGVPFPRKEEWVLNYLLWTLGKETLGSSEDVESIWQTVAAVCNGTSTGRLKVISRKFDLPQITLDLLQYCVAKSSCHAFIHATSMMQRLASERSSKKVFLTTMGTSVATLMACLQLCSQNATVPQSLVELSVELLLYNTSRRSNTRKLELSIHSHGLEVIVRFFATKYDTESVQTLLKASIFSETGLENLEVLRVSLSKCSKEVGMEQFCRASFRSLHDQSKNSAKALKARNALLGIWLETSQLSASALKIYKETQPETKITRLLSSDEGLSPVLNSVIMRAFDDDLAGTETLMALLDIDLDTLYPVHEAQMWTYIARSQDQFLLIQWLRAYIKVRAVVPGLQTLLRSTTIKADMLSHNVVNILAGEIAKTPLVTQKTLMDDLLGSESQARPVLLTALIGGLSRSSPVLQDRLHELEGLGKENAQVSRLINLKADPSILSPDHITESLQCSPTAECWLRQVELGFGEEASETRSMSAHRVIEIARRDSDFREVIVCRWLPVLMPLTNEEQKKEFIDCLHDDIRARPNLLTHANLLECEALHDVLQAKFISMLHTDDWSTLLRVPIEFFHKAVRRSIIAQLLVSGPKVHVRMQLLLKFARSGLLPNFESADAFIDFANTTIVESAAGTNLSPKKLKAIQMIVDEGEVSELLRHKLIGNLSYRLSEDIVMKVECPSLLKLEMLDHHEFPAHILIKVRSELISKSLEIILKSPLDPDIWQIPLSILLGLIRHEYRPKPIPTEATFKQLVASYLDGSDMLEELQRVVMAIADPRSAVKLSEILAFQCNNAAEAMTLIRNHKTLQELEQILFALAMALPFTELVRLVPLCNFASETTGSQGTLVSWQLLSILVRSKWRSTEIDSSWLSDQLILICQTCLKSVNTKSKSLAFEIAQETIQCHGRCITIANIDYICLLISSLAVKNDNLDASFTSNAHKLLRAMFLHHANLLRDRYQVIVNLFQQLLTPALEDSSASKDSVESLTRLFETFLSSSRALSTLPEQFNKAFAKHVPWLLIQYIHNITNSGSGKQIPVEAKKILEEGLVYEVMSLCGSHEREMIGASLDSAGRGTFKRLYDEWTRFGKWTEK